MHYVNSAILYSCLELNMLIDKSILIMIARNYAPSHWLQNSLGMTSNQYRWNFCEKSWWKIADSLTQKTQVNSRFQMKLFDWGSKSFKCSWNHTISLIIRKLPFCHETGQFILQPQKRNGFQLLDGNLYHK